MKAIKIIVAIVLTVFANCVFALTETVNGITWEYSVYDGAASIVGVTFSESTSITLPSELGTCPVTQIADAAFRNNLALTDVTIPNGIESIGDRAFYGCANLTNIVLCEGVQNIGLRAFQYCSDLRNVTLPRNLIFIDRKAFADCYNIERVNIDSIESYLNIEFGSGTSTPICYAHAYLYTNDVRIVELIIPPSIREIKTCAFYGEDASGSYRMQSVFIPSGVTNIAAYAFGGYALFPRIVFDKDIGPLSIGFQFQDGNACANVEIMPREGYIFEGWVDDTGTEVANLFLSPAAITVSPLWQRAAPIISPGGAMFANVSQEVSIDCEAYAATIYYTTDGGDPLECGMEYKRPFTVYKSCTVRAVAVDDNGNNSVVATATFTRGESLSEAANLYGYTMETDSAAPWTVDAAVSHDGVSSVRSGAIGNNGTTYLMASVKKAGTVSFWWKAQCEAPDEEDGEDGYYDYGAFLVDDVIKARIAGNDTGWRFVSVGVPTGGKHVLRWEYRKDNATSYAPDCVWLDQVQWIPADGSGATLTSPEPVPYSWLSQYGLGVASGDFEAAANAASGKTQGGAVTSVWEEFVAGTDPTNALSVFTAKIEFKDGAPVVKWEPDLNENGTKSERLYKVYGRESLGDDSPWQYPTNSLHRFFKVAVEMP